MNFSFAPALILTRASLALLLFAFTSPSSAVTDLRLAPFKISACVALLTSAAVEKASNNSLPALRDFRHLLLRELGRAQARRRGIKDYLIYEYRHGAVTHPNVDEVEVAERADANGDFELSLGRAIGRLEQLEHDVGQFRAGVFSFARVARGAEEIRTLWTGLRATLNALDEDLAARVRAEIPYFNSPRQKEIERALMGTGYAATVVAVMALPHSQPMPWIAWCSLLTPFIFRENIASSWLYARSLVSADARMQEENQWFYRIPGLSRMDLAVTAASEGLPFGFSYLASGVGLTEKVGRAVTHGRVDSSLGEEMFKSFRGNFTGFTEEDNDGFGAIDMILFRDPETSEPVLVLGGRMARLVVPPDKPRKKEAAATQPDWDWGAEGLPGAVRRKQVESVFSP